MGDESKTNTGMTPAPDPHREPAPIEEESATGRVLHLVYGSDHVEAQQPHRPAPGEHGEDEDKVEVDERWLMTYADKMTLLCGLFIMLFAMSTMDKVKLEKIKESTQKSFGKPNADKKEIETARLTEQNKVLQAKIEQQTQQLALSEKTVRELQVQLQKISTPAPTVVPTVDDSRERIRKLEEELQRIQAQTKTLEQQKQELEQQVTQLSAATDKTTVVKEQVEKLKKENIALKHTVVTTQDTLKVTQEEVKKLEEQISQLKAANSDVAFMAFMMKWATNDHDLDLRVEDPSGHRFDFKHRKYKGVPGTFVLDTRRGPGMEVWQSDRVVAGTYKFTYQFYNAYGNVAPCPVTATLFTAKGSVDLPSVTLDIAKKREFTFQVRVDEHGQATLLE